MDMNEPQAIKRSLDPSEDQQVMSMKLLKCNPESSQNTEYQENLTKETKDLTNQAGRLVTFSLV